MSTHRYDPFEDFKEPKEDFENLERDFTRRYQKKTKGYEIHSQEDPEDEGHFSWSPCDTCGSRLGGNRTTCLLTNPGVDRRGKKYPVVRVESCDDCLYFAAYGRLSD